MFNYSISFVFKNFLLQVHTKLLNKMMLQQVYGKR